jgi:hypothetical protein
MRLSALDCMARGASILRANGRLVFWRWGFMLVPTLFGVLALALPLLVAGVRSLGNLPEDPLLMQAWLGDIADRLMAADPQTMLLAAVGSAALLLLMVVAWAFVEAGSYGILYGADRQAPPKAPPGPWYRTLSLREFLGWAGRYLWRYLGLLLLWCLLTAAVSFALGLLIAFAGVGAARWGTTAGFAIGCGGALPLGFLLVVLIAGLWLAMADLVREESGAWRGLATGLRVFGRRMGAVLLLLLVWLFGMIVVAIVFEIPGLLLHAAVAESLPLPLPRALDLVLRLIESLASDVVHLWLMASLVVLVRAEVGAARSNRTSSEQGGPAVAPPAGEAVS